MEMLNRMGLARLVNPCFKIAALEISGCLVVRSSETTKKFTGQPIFGGIKRLVARRKKQRTTQPKVGNKLHVIINCTRLTDGFVLSMSDSVKLIIINLPQLSVFLCFGYLSVLQNIARYENVSDKHKVACLVGNKIKDAILNMP